MNQKLADWKNKPYKLHGTKNKHTNYIVQKISIQIT